MEGNMQHGNWVAKTRGFLILMASAIAAAGCGGTSDGGSNISSTQANSSTPPAVAQAQDAKSPVSASIVSSDNEFGLTVLKQITQGSSTNVAISPLSLSLVLQILYAGSAGTTTQAMAQALQLGTTTASTINVDNASLQASLVGADPAVTLNIANSLWINLTSTPVRSTFTQMDENYYAAKVGDIAGAPANVNDWVGSATNGLITSILPPNAPVGGYQGAIIANALYFKGSWSVSFDPGQTTAQPFTRNDGTQVAVSTMHQTGSFAYLQQGSMQAVRLPYGNGRFAMLLVLPDAQTNIADFLSNVTPTQLASWNSGLQDTQLSVALPKFTATFGASLVKPLTTLGMGIVFTPTADFSNLATGAYVSDVEHKTVIEVDETGTIAAAATGISMTTIVGPTLSLNRPFLYAIEDTQTQELLFIGVLMDPS